jgi:hypothetical protein
MKKSILILSALAATLAFACNDAPKEESTTENTTAETTFDPANEAVASDGAMPMDQPVMDPAAASAPAASSSGKRLNPPHGEPGHVCELPVGEPLPDNNVPGGVKVQTPPPASMQDPNAGKPSAPPPVSIMNQSAPVAQPAAAPTTAAPGKTAPGMNPPHGEPGHDCAIPVGSPLKK